MKTSKLFGQIFPWKCKGLKVKVKVWKCEFQNCLARRFSRNIFLQHLSRQFRNLYCGWFRHGDDMVTLWWKYDDGLICYDDFMMMLWWLYDASRMMLWRLNDEDMMILHGTAQPRLPPSLAMSWIRLHHVRCSPVKKMLTYQMQLHFTNKLLLDINSCSLLTCNFVLTFSPILYFYKWFSRKKP